MPRKNNDDSALVDLGGVHVYRAASSFDDYCAACPQRYERLFDYEYRGPVGKRPGKDLTSYRDTAVETGNVYTYLLRAYNEAGTAGQEPTPLVVHYDTALRAPQDFELERKGPLVVLSWSPVEELMDGRSVDEAAGYRVYRRTEAGEYELPLNGEAAPQTFFEDTPPAFDVVYFYTVRSIRTHEQSIIESDIGEEIRIAYYDTTPPEAPQFLTAIARDDGVLLKWMLSAEEDFAGYNVYRRTPGRGEFVRLNTELLKENSWLDTTAVKRRRYEYAVTAIDASLSANESAFSETAVLRYIPN
jgi:fibronectin type 3 domain-containing protein